MFTKILNVVQLFTKPTVVIVIVQAAYCCYCSSPAPCCLARGRDGPAVPTGTCVRGVFTALFTAARRPPGPPTHDLKAGLHHLSHREAYGATWSSLGSSLATSTFGRPAQFGPTLGNWSQVLAYCCSRGLLFTSVVHEAHCCSVVTVNNTNSVQLLTFGSSTV